MFLSKRRMFQVTLLSLASCVLLLLVVYRQEKDIREAKQDQMTTEKARADAEKKTDPETKSAAPVKQPSPAKKRMDSKSGYVWDVDVKSGSVSCNGTPLADWIAQLQDKDTDVRRQAAQAFVLGDNCNRLVKPPESLLRALAQALRDKDSIVCLWASSALIRFGKAAVPSLEEALFTEKDAEARREAAKALGNIGEPALPVVFKAAKSQDAETRRLVLTVASFFRDKDTRRKVVPAVVLFLKEKDTSFRRDAAGFFQGDNMAEEVGEALPALLEASKPDDSAGLAARYALTRPCKAPRAIAPALRHFLKDPEPRIRLKAAEVLYDMEEADKECLACALELIKRRDSQIREGAARLLSKYGSAAKDAVPALIEIVRNDKGVWGTRIQAINALVAIGPDAKAAIPVLKAMQDDPQIGSWAKPALKKIER